MGRFAFSVARPLGIVLITGKKESTVALTSEDSLKSILIVQTTKPLTDVIPRQWLVDASLRRAAKNLQAQYNDAAVSSVPDKDEIPPTINYVGIILRPFVYVKAVDMRDRSVIQPTNTKMIDAIVEALIYSFQKTINRYVKGERTYMEKDNIDLYYHFAKFRPLISNGKKNNVVSLAFYNTEVLGEIMKLDSSLDSKGYDIKVNKGADTVQLYFFYDKKLEHSVWKKMPERGTPVAPGGITRRLETSKKTKGTATVQRNIIDYSLYEVNYEAPGIYFSPLVNTLAKKELAIVEIALASIFLDPHSFSSYELTSDEKAQADTNIRDIKYEVCVSVGKEHKFDFEAIQRECCLYDHSHVKFRARTASSLEATGIIKAIEDVKKDKILEQAKKKEDELKMKKEMDAFKTPEEKHKEVYDPSKTISYYDDNNRAIKETVKVESVMRFVRKVSIEELIRTDGMDEEFDMLAYEKDLLETYGPDAVFY